MLLTKLKTELSKEIAVVNSQTLISLNMRICPAIKNKKIKTNLYLPT
jgi:hypothetical protein